MKPCTWSRGCSTTIGSDERLCSYHGKVSDGFITSTRGVPDGDASTSTAVVAIPLSARERAAAQEAQEEYAAQQERRAPRRDELD